MDKKIKYLFPECIWKLIYEFDPTFHIIWKDIKNDINKKGRILTRLGF